MADGRKGNAGIVCGRLIGVDYVVEIETGVEMGGRAIEKAYQWEEESAVDVH